MQNHMAHNRNSVGIAKFHKVIFKTGKNWKKWFGPRDDMLPLSEPDIYRARNQEIPIRNDQYAEMSCKNYDSKNLDDMYTRRIFPLARENRATSARVNINLSGPEELSSSSFSQIRPFGRNSSNIEPKIKKVAIPQIAIS